MGVAKTLGVVGRMRRSTFVGQGFVGTGDCFSRCAGISIPLNVLRLFKSWCDGE